MNYATLHTNISSHKSAVLNDARAKPVSDTNIYITNEVFLKKKSSQNSLISKEEVHKSVVNLIHHQFMQRTAYISKRHK